MRYARQIPDMALKLQFNISVYIQSSFSIVI